MPSPDPECSQLTGDQKWLTCQIKVINQYSAKIESCLEGSAWQMLAFVLRSRECYLRELYSSPIAAHFRSHMKKLAEDILAQDKILNELVVAQKNALREKQLAFDRNKRALSKYDQANQY